jgi:hypothetical protein
MADLEKWLQGDRTPCKSLSLFQCNIGGDISLCSHVAHLKVGGSEASLDPLVIQQLHLEGKELLQLLTRRGSQDNCIRRRSVGLLEGRATH